MHSNRGGGNFIPIPIKTSAKAGTNPRVFKKNMSVQTDRLIYLKEEGIAFSPTNPTAKQLNDGGMKRDYAKAVNYINACHKFINAIVEKKAQDKNNQQVPFVLPMVANYSALFDGMVTNQAGNKKKISERNAVSKSAGKSGGVSMSRRNAAGDSRPNSSPILRDDFERLKMMGSAAEPAAAKSRAKAQLDDNSRGNSEERRPKSSFAVRNLPIFEEPLVDHQIPIGDLNNDPPSFGDHNQRSKTPEMNDLSNLVKEQISHYFSNMYSLNSNNNKDLLEMNKKLKNSTGSGNTEGANSCNNTNRRDKSKKQTPQHSEPLTPRTSNFERSDRGHHAYNNVSQHPPCRQQNGNTEANYDNADDCSTIRSDSDEEDERDDIRNVKHANFRNKNYKINSMPATHRSNDLMSETSDIWSDSDTEINMS